MLVEPKSSAEHPTTSFKYIADQPIEGQRRSDSKFSLLPQLIYPLEIFWLFTESDFFTFVLPNTAFGILGALSGSNLTTEENVDVGNILRRLPVVILFNWSNLFIFDLANQRLPEAIKEDTLNKPWRPLPTGTITPQQTRRTMIVMIPLVLCINAFLGVGTETALLIIQTWIYNDLKGGDEIIRDLLLATAFAFYNHGSLKLATDRHTEINEQGYLWIAVVSGVILTTIQVQDLKDQTGDRERGRRSIPLVFGDVFSRRMVSCGVIGWSLFCACFWCLQPWAGVLIGILGSLIAFRALWWRSSYDDDRTWRLWCAWTAALYALPLVSRTLDSPGPILKG